MGNYETGECVYGGTIDFWGCRESLTVHEALPALFRITQVPFVQLCEDASFNIFLMGGSKWL